LTQAVADCTLRSQELLLNCLPMFAKILSYYS
jgi:hypothetical protein